ncbi:MAG: hypothetical protein A3I05_05770 [Deltaproteobacteria bacterium RIFCSPLOWO2_02_FULL_44_10]|nr:MAG: hypothetical protein A3C46_04595 [Deltaproteobacteria bacterium RIFCSPHIGHO2_02_FULL_44_16]OGQ46117.1 MAG: hypothetical protein A3I05_05770 [Deltaproteobacteria bacterium RIFCSPLOWO2_02_FULL_44_10]
MLFQERIEEDLHKAMKSKDLMKVRTLRMVVAAIKNKRIEEKGPLNDETILKLIGVLIKQRQEAAELFRKGNRPEKAHEEEVETELLKAYLPEQLSATEAEKLIDAAIAEVGEKGNQAMGAVMKLLMPKIQGRVDGKWVSDLVRKKLS